MVSALRDVVDSRWCVPGEKEISFAIAVVGEEIAQFIEVEIVRIAESVCDHLTLPAIGGQAEQGTTLHLTNGRMGQGYVLGSKAAVVAANDVPPAVRSLAHGVAAVLREGQRDDALGWPICSTLSAAVLVARKPAAAAEIEVIAVETHAHAARRGRRKERGFIGFARALGVMEHFDVSRPRHHHPA